MTSNKLKILAITFMIIDHYATLFMPYGDTTTIILRFIGRFAAPIFCFLVAEGYHHSSNRIKYFLRLLLFAAISHVPFTLAFGYPVFPIEKTSIMWPLSLGLLALMVAKNPKINPVFKMVLILGLCFAADFGDWNFVVVLWILAFGMFKGSILPQLICFIAVGWVFYVQPILGGMTLQLDKIYPQYAAFGVFASIIFIVLYNNKKGINSKALSLLFYILYPLHIAIFYLIDIGGIF